MANVLTSATQISKIIPIYYDRVFLERLESNRIMVFHQFATKKKLPKRQGQTVYWHQFTALSRAKMITESSGVAGQYQGISARRVSAALMLIGDHARITSYVDMVSVNSVVEGAVQLFAECAAWSVDFVIGRSILWNKTSLSARFESTANSGTLGNANYLSAAGTVSAAQFRTPLWIIDDLTTRNHALSALKGTTSATLLTPNVFRWAKLKLKVKMARPFPNGHYRMVTHPDMVEQLRGSSAFIAMHQYSTQSQPIFDQGTLPGGKSVREMNGFEGYFEGFDVFSTTECPMVAATSAKSSAHGGGRYYFNFFFGQDAYGVTDFDGGVQTYVKTPGPQTTSDPLSLYSTVGFRAILAAQVLNPSAIIALATGKPSVVG